MPGETCARPDVLLSVADRFGGLGDDVDRQSQVDEGAVDVLDGLLVPALTAAAREVASTVAASGDGLAEALGVVRTDLRAWARGFQEADS